MTAGCRCQVYADPSAAAAARCVRFISSRSGGREEAPTAVAFASRVWHVMLHRPAIGALRWRGAARGRARAVRLSGRGRAERAACGGGAGLRRAACGVPHSGLIVAGCSMIDSFLTRRPFPDPSPLDLLPWTFPPPRPSLVHSLSTRRAPRRARPRGGASGRGGGRGGRGGGGGGGGRGGGRGGGGGGGRGGGGGGCGRDGGASCGALLLLLSAERRGLIRDEWINR